VRVLAAARYTRSNSLPTVPGNTAQMLADQVAGGMSQHLIGTPIDMAELPVAAQLRFSVKKRR